MLLKKLFKGAVSFAVDLILEPLPDEEYDEYKPSTKSIAVDENGNTVQLVGSSQGWKVSDLS